MTEAKFPVKITHTVNAPTENECRSILNSYIERITKDGTVVKNLEVSCKRKLFRGGVTLIATFEKWNP